MTKLARALLLLALTAGTILPAIGDDKGYVVYHTETPFEDVLDGLRAAIQEHGFHINNVMDLGEMLERTSGDLGLGAPAYSKAKSVELCSAVLSHAMTSENPARIVNCPFIISVYQLRGESGTTYVAHREIPQEEQDASPPMAKVAAMLKTLSEAAIAW